MASDQEAADTTGPDGHGRALPAQGVTLLVVGVAGVVPFERRRRKWEQEEEEERQERDRALNELFHSEDLLDDPEPEDNDDWVVTMTDNRPMGAVCDDVFAACDNNWSQGSVGWRAPRFDNVESMAAVSLRQTRAVQVGPAPARSPEAVLIRSARRERIGRRPLLCRSSVVWLAACLMLGTFCFGGAAWFSSVPDRPAARAAAAAHANPASNRVTFGTKSIEEVQVGDRLAGRNPLREQVDDVEPDPATWRKIKLCMTKENGRDLHLVLLRPLTWIEKHHAKPGSTIFIDLYEMGAVGDAIVTDLGPCPEIEPGKGTIVTGTFKHQADTNTDVVHLQLEDQIELTGVTANHPYWSEDRQDFVEVGDLRIGELVDTVYGVKQVVSVSPIRHDGLLYNLETGEHVYRVGSLATLVHNFCVHRITPDAQGRVRSAVAHITPDDLGTGTATNSATRAAAKALGRSSDEAGHLIGKLLGGPGGKTSGNFFAQNPHINRGQFAQLEQRVAGFVRNGDNVWIRVTPQYLGSSTRATGVLYQVRVNSRIIISRLFGN